MVLGAGVKAPASPVAVTLFSCAPACTEPARLIQGGPHRQLAGIFAVFNSQSSQEPAEGLSVFPEMKGRHEGQSWEWFVPKRHLKWKKLKQNNSQSGHFSSQQVSAAARAGSPHPACKQPAEASGQVPTQCKQRL